jgi:hypothetical protein
MAKEEGTLLLSDRFKAVMERVVQLPAAMQDELARVLEEALAQMAQPGPQLPTEWRASIERAMREQAET